MAGAVLKVLTAAAAVLKLLDQMLKAKVLEQMLKAKVLFLIAAKLLDQMLKAKVFVTTMLIHYVLWPLHMRGGQGLPI